MDKVYMTHPNLPGQPITVFASAVPVHEMSGWIVGGAPPAPPPQPEPKTLPAKNASKAEWEQAARDAQIPEAEITGKSRDELIARLAGNEE